MSIEIHPRHTEAQVHELDEFMQSYEEAVRLIHTASALTLGHKVRMQLDAAASIEAEVVNLKSQLPK